MKKFLGMFLLVLFVVSSFAEVGVTDDKILVGTFQAMSGPVAGIGRPMAQGMQAYFNYINENGGIYGREIELIVADDQFNPAKTVVEVRRMVEQDGVFAIVGGLGTPGILAVQDYLNNNKVPFVYQGGGSIEFSLPPKKYIFPVQPNYIVEGNIVINYLVEQGHERIAIVYRNAEDGQEFSESAVGTLKSLGMEPVANIAVDPFKSDFTPEVTRLLSARPDAVAVMLFLPQSVGLVRQAKQYGMTDQRYLLTYSNADETYLQLAGEAGDGVEVMAWVAVDFTNPQEPAIQIYQKYYNQIPNAYAIAGMIAAEVFVEGVKRAGPDLTREKLVEALETLDNWKGNYITLGDENHGLTYKPVSQGFDSRMGMTSMYVLKSVLTEYGLVWDFASNWMNYSVETLLDVL
jgi:branched-chain amino acid transport system substrate-binding protein